MPREVCCGFNARRPGLPANAYWGLPCGAPAKVARDGKPYCLRHDPERKLTGAAATAAEMKRLRHVNAAMLEALEASVGRGYCETSGSIASQDYVSKAAIAKVRAAIALAKENTDGR